MYLEKPKPILTQLKRVGVKSSQTVLTQTNYSLTEFSSKIEREFIDDSAIAPALYEAAIEIVSDTEVSLGGEVVYPIHEALNWRLVLFGAQARDNLEAALFKNESGSTWQAKLSHSLEAGKKPYFAPTGNGSRVFLPSIPISIRQKIGCQHSVTFPSDGSFWNFIDAHTEIPIVLTEGGKKSLALLSSGYVAIALYGKDSGVSKHDRGNVLDMGINRVKLPVQTHSD